MNLDDFKPTWKQRQNDLSDGHVDDAVARIRSRTSWFERCILRRDIMETCAAIFVIVVFGSAFFRWESWLARVGVITILLGTLEVLFVMHWARRRGGRPRRDLPLLDFCTAELARVDLQIWLLRNVTLWYSGPILLGCCLFTFGISTSLYVMVRNCTLFFAFGAFVHWLNRRGVRKELAPLREELISACEAFEEDPSIMGETE